MAETLHPGQQIAIAADGRLLGTKAAILDNVTAWQRGKVNLDNSPLEVAVAQINCYSSVKVQVPDPELAAARISGVFRTGDSRSFVSALERLLGVKAEWAGGQTAVFRQEARRS